MAWEYTITSDKVSLNEQGAAGWELVNAVQTFFEAGGNLYPNPTRLYWKRLGITDAGRQALTPTEGVVRDE